MFINLIPAVPPFIHKGGGRVEVMAPSELTREYKTTVSQIIRAAQQQGYTVLGWEQYLKLLDEIGNLTGEDEEQGRITGSPERTAVGIPVTATGSTQEVKILPKSSPLDLQKPLDIL